MYRCVQKAIVSSQRVAGTFQQKQQQPQQQQQQITQMIGGRSMQAQKKAGADESAIRSNFSRFRATFRGLQQSSSSTLPS